MDVSQSYRKFGKGSQCLEQMKWDRIESVLRLTVTTVTTALQHIYIYIYIYKQRFTEPSSSRNLIQVQRQFSSTCLKLVFSNPWRGNGLSQAAGNCGG